MRRIALFTGNYDLLRDGVSLTLNRLVDHLERRGIGTLVFAPTARRPAMPHAGTLVSVPSLPAPVRTEYRVSLGLWPAATRALKRFRPTLFHIATPDLLGRRALSLASRWGVPAVASYHTHFCSYLRYYRLEAFEGLLWKYLRRFYRRCRQVYVASPSIAAVLRAHEIDGDLRLWERGVDTERFRPERRSLAWRRSLGVADTEPLVTFVGRAVPEKGVDVLVGVLRALEAAGVLHRSMVVGDGPVVQRLAARLPRTIFTGFLTGDLLATAYASSDVFLFPSDTETFGNVTLEAMASGLPCVCADAPGSSSLVEHTESGFLARRGNVAQFTAYLGRLAIDRPLRLRLGAAARERARRYEWREVLDRLVTYYDEVLASERAPARLTDRPDRSRLAG